MLAGPFKQQQETQGYLDALKYLQIDINKHNFVDFGFRVMNDKIDRIMSIKMAGLKVDYPVPMKPNCSKILVKLLKAKAKSIHKNFITVN